VHEPEPAPSRADQRRRTEARILAAAARLFVERGYERTTIREVARTAGVDGGLVMHYFGSKQQLFQRVTHDPPVQELTGTADDVTEQILAALAGAVMLSVIVSRHLLRTGALSDASPEHVIDLLRPCLRSLTRAGPGPAPEPLLKGGSDNGASIT